MCAIAGIIHSSDSKALPKMLSAMAHRGPDDYGEYHDHERQISLGHRRLSIIDLSPAGHQPMLDESGDVIVVFNGEIYNYKELRAKLKNKGHNFRSESDTEVIVEGYKEYGSDIFKKLNGMWAIAVYDKKRRILTLSRDPAGMKPLYIYHSAGVLAFASEIEALSLALPAGSLTIDSGSISMYLRHRYIYGTRTIYHEIEQVAPASTMTFMLDDMNVRSEVHYVPKKKYIRVNLDDTVTEFSRLFQTSVQETLQSDVPVGLFLSGGIDSSLVGHAVHQAGIPLHSFTVDFEHKDFNEANIAGNIARHLGLPHAVWRMTADDVLIDIEKILDAFGQPFGDMSVLPTYYASKMARQNGYKVVLTGDGADELFGGYPTHYLPVLSKIYRKTPAIFDTLFGGIAGILPSSRTRLGMKEKLERFLYGVRSPFRSAHAQWKKIFSPEELDRLLDSQFLSLKENTQVPDFDEFFKMISPYAQDDVDEVIKTDFMTFLPSDCLVKSDISSMQNSVELRSPFLNKEIIDFAWHLPSDMKARAFRTKIVLRKALSRALPSRLTRLPKKGFVPPLSFWLCTTLKSTMLDILSQQAIAKVGFLKYDYVATLLEEHLDHRRDHAAKIWCLLSLVRFYSRHAEK